MSLRLYSECTRSRCLPILARTPSQGRISKVSTLGAELLATGKQVLTPPPVTYYSDEKEEYYWKGIPRWKDAAVDKFLSHKWQVSLAT